MSFFSRKEQIIVVLLIAIVLFISLFNFANKNIFSKQEVTEDEIENLLKEIETEEEEEEEINITSESQEIMVHISGQVNNPGLVILNQGDRVIDAVNLAGGLKNNCDLDKINLAKKLSDEEKIYIPEIGENIDIEVSNFESASSDTGKVNINTCTKEELISLPGIGEVIADRILDYREQNPFKSIEDIMNVSGIGEKKFESIKELIIIN